MKHFFEKFKRVLFRNSGEDISYEEAKKILLDHKEAYLIDVRSSQEYQEGHLEGSINLPLYELESKIETKIPEKDTMIILYCRSGNRSKNAKDLLKSMGYTNVYHIKGGIDQI